MSTATGAPRSNVLLINCHDLGRFLGTYGVGTVSTPHIDALADAGVTFDSAFATAPQCSPARASLFTGKYPQRNGVLGLTHGPFSWDLTDPHDHLAYRLTAEGYRSTLIGVQHESLVLTDDAIAGRLGFDTVLTGGTGEVVADRTIEALRESTKDERTFYLQVGFYEPHRWPSPRDAPGVMGFLGAHIEPDRSKGVAIPEYLQDDDLAQEEIAELQGAVRYMDQHLGRILDAIEQLGLAKSTIIVFTTDHGLALPRAKCSLYEPGLEVALIMRVPSREHWAGARVGGMVTHLDVRPTLLDLVGLARDEDAHGSSLIDVVERQAPATDFVFGQITYHDYYAPKRSVRSATHKLIVTFSSAPKYMDPTQSWVRRTTAHDLLEGRVMVGAPMEFYDLRSDPGEMSNLVHHPAARGELEIHAAALWEWMREMDDPLLVAAVTSPQHNEALSMLQESVGRSATPGRERDGRIAAT